MKIENILETKKKEPALVIAGFPGIGKSYFKKNHDSNVLDSDSSIFSWKDSSQKVRDPDFPNNYIKHIKNNLNKVDIIMVSTHDEVRKALENNEIDYLLVYPEIELKDDYIKRYTERGNDDNFIKFISDGWNEMINNLKKETYPEHSMLKRDEYLTDAIIKDKTNK